MTEIVLATFNGLLAGAFVVAALLSLALQRDGDADRALPWIAALATAQAVTMAAGAVAIARPDPLPYEVALFVQDLARELCAILIVRTLMAMVPRLRLGWLIWAFTAVAAVRAVLWWPTDLILDHPLHADRVPTYGPLSVSSWALLAGISLAGVLAAWHGTRQVRRMLAVIAPLAVVPRLVSIEFAEGFTRLQLENLTTAGVGIGILGLLAMRAAAAVRRKDTLLYRQAILARFAESAVDAESAERVRDAAEYLLRQEFADAGLTVRFVAPGQDPVTNGALGLVTVRGRSSIVTASAGRALQDHRQTFVENLLQIVAARSDRDGAESDILHAATHDPVTGLPNQALFLDRLAGRLAAAADDGSATLVAVCGIAGTGTLASVHGHAAQERVSREAAALLAGALGDHVVLAQLSPVTFGIVDRVAREESAPDVERRLTAVQTVLEVGLSRSALRTAIGAVLAEPGSDAPGLLRDAMAAIGQASASGSAVEIFDAALGARLRRRAELEADLRLAVERGEIGVEYQPIVDVRHDIVIGYEALARWQRDDDVTTAEWITIAEHNGLIHEIGRHVLTVAARDQAQLGLPVSVNVSAVQLTRPDFVGTVLAALGVCPPDQVVLEVTETAVVSDPHRAAVVLERLRMLGIRVALDDFGTSYSSLSALADLPVDIVKIDRLFVQRVHVATGAVMVAAIVAMAEALGLSTVAEGVESYEQFATLDRLGVNAVQGYVVGRPATVARLRLVDGARPSPRPRVPRTGIRSVGGQ